MKPPLSPARVLGGTVYASGQCGIDPATGQAYDDFAVEVREALAALQSVLLGAGSTIGDVVRTTVYLTDMALFGVMNEEYVKVFSEPYPARATVQAGLALPSLRVEIDAIAARTS